MKFIYRISDQSYPKTKLPHATKERCLSNFLEVFSPDRNELRIIADNCRDETYEWLTRLGFEVVRTAEGNAGSFRVAKDLATEEPGWVYLVEDDYLHAYGAKERLLEAAGKGLADYLTLYDHPDKYSADYGGGEQCRVMRAGTQHWRTTVSTTMTFAATGERLKKDFGIWKPFVCGSHPHDHFAFLELGRQGRTLAVAIPGLACHVDLTWGLSKRTLGVEPWAMRLLAQGAAPSRAPSTISGGSGT